MGEPIQWGILGNSTIGRKCVIPAICKSRNGAVHAMASRSPAQAESVAFENGIERIYDTYDDVLADPFVDAVYIPLPNHLHHRWTLKALGAGKHVLCEKPLACNARQAEEMAGASADTGLLLMEAFMYRFHPRSRRIRQIVIDGEIGTPRLVRASFCYPMEKDLLEAGNNARLKSVTGGGALMDVGCYCVGISRWLLGSEPLNVQAQAMYNEQGADLHMVAILGFPGGAMATFEASFVSALQQTYTVTGDRGAIELPHNAFIPWEKDAVFGVREADAETGTTHVVPGVDEYLLMVEHFADAVAGDTEPELPSLDSINNMRVLDALAEAARTGNTVSMKQEPVE